MPERGSECRSHMTYKAYIKLYEIIRLVILKTLGKKRQKRSPNVVFVDDVDKCYIINTKSVGIIWRKCHLKRKILVERADIVTWKSRYLKEVQECWDNGQLMFYMHKTWTDSNLTFRKS